jgi:hypothetical protein
MASLSQRVFITLRYLDSGNALDNMKFSFPTCSFTVDIAQHNTVHSKWILRNTANIQLTYLNTR